MWEVFTQRVPWHDLTDSEREAGLLTLVRAGRRPTFCDAPHDYATIMDAAWAGTMSIRPTFADLALDPRLGAVGRRRCTNTYRMG